MYRSACFAGKPAPTGVVHALKPARSLWEQLFCSTAKASAIPVGAGLPANTGVAGARHRVACFAGKPAPTGAVHAPRCPGERDELEPDEGVITRSISGELQSMLVQLGCQLGVLHVH
jgi:hypothetical protein